MGECGKIMSIQHAKFLWEVMRRFARELITPSLNGIKLFASSLIGLIFIPHIAIVDIYILLWCFLILLLCLYFLDRVRRTVDSLE